MQNSALPCEVVRGFKKLEELVGGVFRAPVYVSGIIIGRIQRSRPAKIYALYLFP